jgi:hypothetical protein
MTYLRQEDPRLVAPHHNLSLANDFSLNPADSIVERRLETGS